MSPRAWCIRSPAPPPTKPTSTRWRRSCTAARRRSSPDAGYTGAQKRPELAERKVSWNIAIRRGIIKALPEGLRDLAEPVERALSQVRAWVEHPFHIVKNLFRHKKLRYRGLAKNTAQLHTLFALANLVIVKKTLLAQPQAC
jgi:IS5 family transposase